MLEGNFQAEAGSVDERSKDGQSTGCHLTHGKQCGCVGGGGHRCRAGEDESTSEAFGKPAGLALGQPLQCTVVTSTQQSLLCGHIIICRYTVLTAFQALCEEP